MMTEKVQIIEELRKAPIVALFSHVSPDGDCIGSMLAIGLALEKLGKTVYYYNPDPIPYYLEFLPGAQKVSATLPEPLPKILLFVDCTDMQRANLSPSQLSGEQIILNLDHHISNQLYGHYNWVETEASASGEIAFALITGLGVEIDQDIAADLYTALVTDTGLFQYGNTTAKTHRLAADLLEYGLDLTFIHHNLFDRKPLAQVRLLCRALSRLEIHAGGKLAVMSLTNQDFAECGAEEALSEGLINHARAIEGVEVAVLLREAANGKVKAGFRSNLWFNVNELAAKFGGGGHKRAAGSTMELPLEKAKEQVIAEIEEALKVGRSN